MQEFANKFSVNQYEFPLGKVPEIYNRALVSGEPLMSQHNKAQVKAYIKEAPGLTPGQKEYMWAIYKELSKHSEHVGQARQKLTSNAPDLFEGREDRECDISILTTLLAPNSQVGNVTRRSNG